MKDYKAIAKEIKANAAKAAELEAAADVIYKTAERNAAQTIAEKIAIRKSITEEEDARGVALYAEAENLKKENAILTESIRASFAEYAAEIIRGIMQKYSGKQYGEKTKKKIWEEAHAAGVGFYFDGYRNRGEVKVYTMADGCKAWGGPEVTLHAVDSEGKRAEFISESNKIADFSAVHFRHYYKYTEDPAEKLAELATAYKKYVEAYNAAKAAQDNLNALLPGTFTRFDAVGYLSHTLAF